MNELLQDYLPLVVFMAVASAICLALLVAPFIVAYKQPVSRAQLSAIRGVNVESTLTTLEQRGYVQEVGHDPGPGQAILYGTTSLFLERVGLDSLRDLPSLAEFVPEPEVVEALERGLLLRIDDAPPDAPPDAPAA